MLQEEQEMLNDLLTWKMAFKTNKMGVVGIGEWPQAIHIA